LRVRGRNRNVDVPLWSAASAKLTSIAVESPRTHSSGHASEQSTLRSYLRTACAALFYDTSPSSPAEWDQAVVTVSPADDPWSRSV
jgi:hypothetical protein